MCVCVHGKNSPWHQFVFVQTLEWCHLPDLALGKPPSLWLVKFILMGGFVRERRVWRHRPPAPPSSCGLWFLVRMQRRIWALTHCKSLLRLGRRQNTSRERWARPREAIALGGWVCQILRQGFLHDPGCQWLTVLIDSCRLYNKKLYCAYPSHSSVCYN